MITYAALLRWPRCSLITVKNKLAKVQRLALMGITGAMRTTPTAALEALLNIEPLHLHVEFVARKTALRLQNSLLNVKEYGHARIWYKMIRTYPQLEMTCDRIPPEYRFERTFEELIPPRDDWKEDKVLPKENSKVWYTDGSKIEASGASYYSAHGHIEQSISLGNHVTVIQSEIVGILQCSLEITNNSANQEHNIICTDSQGAIRALKAYKYTSALVLECRDTLQQIAEKEKKHQ